MAKHHKKYQISADLTLSGAFWPTARPVANLLIISGMEEHVLRYTDFAQFVNTHNFNAFAVDFWGQGENVVSGDHKLGIVPNHGFELFVDSLSKVVIDIKKDGLPLYVLGHSMGSFLAQRFVQKYPQLVDSLVIVGSNGPSLLFGLGKLVASLTVNKNNRDKQSKLLAALSIGGYSKSIKNAKTPVDWISYNEQNVNDYLANPLDGGPSSKGFYLELVRGTAALYKKKHYGSVTKDLPILIVSGEDDPVGLKGKGIQKLYRFYKSLGFKDVKMKLYPKMRHEILNETKKELVYEEVLGFLLKE